MSAERRGRQDLNRNHSTRTGSQVGNPGQKSQFQLEMETNSWLRIGLAAKDTDKQFNNLLCHFNVPNLREAYRALDGTKATGISGMSKRDYAKRLDENLANLVTRIHKGTYRPQPKRRTYIPKANGKQRPIAISEFEDKMVEWVLGKILTALYEPIFIRNSFGFRSNKSAHGAIKAAYCAQKDNKRPYVAEIDLASFFDTVSHRKLKKLLNRRITDKRLLGLIGRFLQAGILENGELQVSEVGAPQGSIMSPILANVFLHYAMDQWFLENYSSQGGVIIRYADDAIFIFKELKTAQNFQEALKERLEAFGLKLNEDKSGLIEFGKRQGNVYHFLGFTFFWGKDYGSSKRVLKVKTQKKQLHKKIQDFTDWIKVNRCKHKLDDIWNLAAAKLRGHYEYYGVHTNRPKLNHFYYTIVGLLVKWLNRRSQKRSFSWKRFERRLRYKPLPKPPKAAWLKSLTDRRYAHGF